MTQAALKIRMNESLKKQLDKLPHNVGMNKVEEINNLARTVVRERRIPFKIAFHENSITREAALRAFISSRNEVSKNELTDTTPEEINNEINTAR